MQITEVDQLDDTGRAEGGFGSSGKVAKEEFISILLPTEDEVGDRDIVQSARSLHGLSGDHTVDFAELPHEHLEQMMLQEWSYRTRFLNPWTVRPEMCAKYDILIRVTTFPDGSVVTDAVPRTNWV